MKYRHCVILMIMLGLLAGGLLGCQNDTHTDDEPDTTVDIVAPVTTPETDDPPENTEDMTETVGSTEPAGSAEIMETTEPAGSAETDPLAAPVDPATLKAFDTYTNSAGSVLSSYTDEDGSLFKGVYRFLSEAGYSLYYAGTIADNRAATYQKDGEVIHLYHQPLFGELNIVTDAPGVSTLPPMDTASGSTPVTVTQLQSAKENGMGYVFRLSDGSFIVYDGGYAEGAAELWDTLVTLNGGESNIRIRAWLLTHSHSDHYPCFTAFAETYAERVTLEYVMYAPTSERDAKQNGDTMFFARKLGLSIKRFAGAAVCIPHTGMAFTIGGVRLDILLCAEELYIDNPPDDFNDSSLVSRVSCGEISMLLLGDSASNGGARLIACYGKELRSDYCQISHHGVEDFPLTGYQLIDASVWFYPCNNMLYRMEGRDKFVRTYLAEKSGAEILIHENGRFTKPLN